ncbi:sugar phosphate isomerase/epimerase family protein [Acidipropionibacterium virtanenii]|uniref:Inosose dehydratase n=1 Tax=Acidipropionibacterium virtanenii TaxID=2057246 RepID=A0A344UXR7_9ACTN|nr:sugar phosphate isomerase/epimerase [Acidipropionibacterium virtanenii]AXE40065.1 Inosose dehydratase [Acidipropionibacterium virtanenii]
MSKANSTDPKYAKLSVGVACDSWGVWFPDDDKQLPPLTVLDQMAESGFVNIETGPYGFFPTDPDILRKETKARGLTVVAGTQGGPLHHREDWDSTIGDIRAVAGTVSPLGAKHLVYLPTPFIDYKTSEQIEPDTIADDAWKVYMEGLNKVGAILRDDYGMTLGVHPHGNTYIQTEEEITRMLADTDPSVVSLCLDTGHVVYSGGDPIRVIADHASRISFVHIKAMDQDVLAETNRNNWSFGEAVAHGVSVTPPKGQPDMVALIDALAGLDKELNVVVEQDLYPVDPAFPLPNAIATREYLAGCNLGSL